MGRRFDIDIDAFPQGRFGICGWGEVWASGNQNSSKTIPRNKNLFYDKVIDCIDIGFNRLRS